MSQLSWITNLSTCSTHVISSISSYHLTNHAKKNHNNSNHSPPLQVIYTPWKLTNIIVTTGNLMKFTSSNFKLWIFQPLSSYFFGVFFLTKKNTPKKTRQVAKATFKSFPVSGSLLMTFPNSKQPPDRRPAEASNNFPIFGTRWLWIFFCREQIWTIRMNKNENGDGLFLWNQRFPSCLTQNVPKSSIVEYLFCALFSFSIKENKQIFVQMIMILV